MLAPRTPTNRPGPFRGPAAVMIASAAAGCAGVQSSLSPGGAQAEWMADLWWWMAAAAAVIWVAVIALAIWCVRWASGEPNRRRDRALIIGGGVVVPVVVLTALLVYGLMLIPPLVARAPENSLQIAVTGEQWWWRVRYSHAGGFVEVANEVRMPVGEPVQFRLDSDNVIHSFWVPALGGKMDMIPGRVTWLALEPTRTGYYRGACAEYCGGSHALMAFDVEVTDRASFDRWLERQAQPAVAPADPRRQQGRNVFFSSGCSACHTIRGTLAAGTIGPDLTHVGGRRTLAASVLPNDPDAFTRWIARPEHIKPGARMPRFDMMGADDLAALAAYLEGLE
jgi:cytochrome c oxidase subunit 2